MRLKLTEQAPDFTAQDVLGFEVNLSDFAGQKILLNFNRYAGCPFCCSYFRRLLMHAKEYQEKGLQIISFFQSPKDSVFRTAEKRTAPFPIIADPDRLIYSKYGVESSLTGALKSVKDTPTFFQILAIQKIPQGPIDGDFFLMPANFLIGPPNLTIYSARYADSFADQMPFAEIGDFASRNNF